MPPKPRLLTKSRFKEAWECQTKLFYTGKPDYGNTQVGDAFLEALAQGGFQVGKLAQLMYPGGIEVETLDTDQAVAETEELMKREQVVIFEAALRHGHLLARVDILVKDGKSLRLIEVKAKSFDPNDESQSFFKKKAAKGQDHPPLRPAWEPYLVDVAFQHLLCRRAYPDCKVAPYLMLADVSRVASVDGLNQCFFLAQDERGRARVELTRAAPELGTPLLIEKWVRKEVEYLQAARYGTLSFSELVDQLAEAYAQDRMLPPVPGKVCRDCQYRTPPEYRDRGLKSGFELCWHDAYRLRPEDLAQPMVFDVAGLSRADELIARGKLFIKDLELSDVAPEAEPGARGGFTQKQRQWAQVRSVREQDPRPVLDRPGLKQELASHHYPLHMIDFETTRVAIPFTRGRRPYETVAFQFSHHLIHKDGRIEHRTEHLDTRPGVFPNFDFARALRGALGSGDDGTLFRYSHHENTTLNEIRRQLEALPRKEAPADRDELIDWIAGVTTGGDRAMVDLCEIAKQRFYHPLMGKSYSLKSVLPAILRDSARLQAKYAQPVYGSAAMPSLNFRDHPWIRFDSEGRVRDPYQTLEPIFDPKLDLALEEGGLLYDDGDGIREGGAAMTAYARMQFTQMTEPERERVSRALKRYCELDTLAMVFLYEYWQEKVADDQ